MTQGWKPIDSAPRDGTRIRLLYPAHDGDDSFVEVDSWIDWGRHVNADSWTIGGLDPTHWMEIDD